MDKLCDFCSEPLKDCEDIGFVATGKFKQIASKIAYAIGKDFAIDEVYHKECLNYILSGGK